MIRILCRHKNNYKDAQLYVKNLIEQKYLMRDVIEGELLNLATDDDISRMISLDSVRNRHCEINLCNRYISLYGEKDSVRAAKSCILLSLHNHNIKISQEMMRYGCEVRWHYATGNEIQWEKFPVHINYWIEKGFSDKKSQVYSIIY